MPFTLKMTLVAFALGGAIAGYVIRKIEEWPKKQED